MSDSQDSRQQRSNASRYRFPPRFVRDLVGLRSGIQSQTANETVSGNAEESETLGDEMVMNIVDDIAENVLQMVRGGQNLGFALQSLLRDLPALGISLTDGLTILAETYIRLMLEEEILHQLGFRW